MHAIIHCLTATRALGSTDGYNMESLEQLHIEFAKDGYWASNKRDYLEQMAVWLQCREVIWLKESYLMWLEDKVALIIVDHGDGDGKDDNKVDVENETSTKITTTEVNKTSSTTTKSKSSTFYTLAKKAPFPNITVDKLITHYGAEDFIPALNTFLLENLPHCQISPNQFNHFDIFKQITITLPPNLFLSNQSRTCCLCSTLAVKPKGWKPGMPGRFDTALIAVQAGDPQRLSSLEGALFIRLLISFWVLLIIKYLCTGLCVGCLHVIFRLPAHFTLYLHPLTYVEWFTPLGRPDTLMGMHVISWSTRFHHRTLE